MSNYILEMIERVPALIRYSDYCQIKEIVDRTILSTIFFSNHLMEMYINPPGIIKKLKEKANTKPQMTTIKICQ